MVRLSPATEVAIRLLPGNDRCVDCKATSFVKSLVMDAWSESEVRALELGGNAKWIAVCAGTGVSDLSMEKKYSSSVAKAYKSRVALAAAKDPSSIVEWRKYERKIGSPGEPLGFTLAKANSGYAEVSRIIPGGTAERANVIVGSLLIGLNDTKNLKFDEVVSMLRTLPRPISFHFVFRAQMASEGPKAVISSVPEPRTVEINVTLQDKEELGCSLAANEFSCVVQNVDEDCIARRHGVLVGSRVVAVNGQKYLKPKDLIREICTAQRPVKITVHRVEGLMRGWSR
ncbi:hypothetical protein PInf_013134 [Phytophthora infestans]|nr:hypothetical protein PInf_013134 [Phytophthora infestans]